MASSPEHGVGLLRKWHRWVARAQAMNAFLLDAALLMGGEPQMLSAQDQWEWCEGLYVSLANTLASLFHLTYATGQPDPAVAVPPPWNRRIRRRLERSNGVLIHLCSGKQRWKPVCHARFEVFEVEIQQSHDILRPSVYSCLLKLARLGLIGGVIGGPSCSTLSRLRNVYDNGPRPLRGRGDETRYGLSDLNEEEHRAVRDSNAIWVRMVAVRLLSHAVNQDTMFGGEQPEDIPNPQNDSQPSIFDWPAIVKLQELFDFRVACFDQLVLGHPTIKPTAVLTNNWDLWVSLHELRATEEERRIAGSPFRGLSVQDRIRLSQKLACWAPGLSMLIAKAWIRWARTPKQERQAAALEEALNLQALTENSFRPWSELRQIVQQRLDATQIESCLNVGKRVLDRNQAIGQLRAARLTIVVVYS